MKPDCIVREARWSTEADTLSELRQEVFVLEQGVPADLESDGRDANAVHVIATIDGQAVGCGRLLPDGRIGRLAVSKAMRNGGIGRRLLQELLVLARRRGEPVVYLHAQCSAAGFYEAAGFAPKGEPFDEAGIAHLNMVQELDYRDWNLTVIGLAYPRPANQLAIALARSARREIAILSPRLDPLLFDQEGFLSTVRLVIRSERQARVRVLVSDTRAIVSRGHGLLALARRLPSKIELRCLAEHPDWDGDTLMIRDRDGLLALPGSTRDPGIFRPDDRARAATALGRFEELWSVGIVDPEFRALSL